MILLNLHKIINLNHQLKLISINIKSNKIILKILHQLKINLDNINLSIIKLINILHLIKNKNNMIGKDKNKKILIIIESIKIQIKK